MRPRKGYGKIDDGTGDAFLTVSMPSDAMALQPKKAALEDFDNFKNMCPIMIDFHLIIEYNASKR